MGVYPAVVLSIPFLAQKLVARDGLYDDNRDEQPADGERKLHLVKALAQQIERPARRHARAEQVEPVREHEARALEQRRGRHYVTYALHLAGNGQRRHLDAN